MLETLASLAIAMKPPITILPGSGINPITVGAITCTGWWKFFQEIHLSGGHWVDGAMHVRRTSMGMGLGGLGEWGIWRTDAEQVKEVVKIAEDSLAQHL